MLINNPLQSLRFENQIPTILHGLLSQAPRWQHAGIGAASCSQASAAVSLPRAPELEDRSIPKLRGIGSRIRPKFLFPAQAPSIEAQTHK